MSKYPVVTMMATSSCVDSCYIEPFTYRQTGKCQHCGSYGEIKKACDSCGATIEPETTEYDSSNYGGEVLFELHKDSFLDKLKRLF
jgi:methionyl-tRNA synthetase